MLCESTVPLYKGEEREVNWGKQNTRKVRKRYYKTKWGRGREGYMRRTRKWKKLWRKGFKRRVRWRR
jgi:hypothetical protein